MTLVASKTQTASAPQRRRLGLSGRLIAVTMAFVIVAEIAVYLPTMAILRRNWLMERISKAETVASVLAATGGEIPAEAARGFMEILGQEHIAVRTAGTRWLAAPGDEPGPDLIRVDMRDPPWWSAMQGLGRAWMRIGTPPGHFLVMRSMPSIAGAEAIEVVIPEAPLRVAMIEYFKSFLAVSLLLAAAFAALLYFALHTLVVRPVLRLSGNMIRFADNPEDAGRVISPSERGDEIGEAEDALARMQIALAGELRQKRHLADLGLAVSKINHELRNMLTTAQLLGDRLTDLDEPTVNRIAPRLVRAIARAIDYCGATLAYGRASEPAPIRRPTALRPLVLEQVETIPASVSVRTEIPDDLRADIDPDQFARVVTNLVRNAVEGLSTARTPAPGILIDARRANGAVSLRVSDNGPGIPLRVRGRLFSPFQGSDKLGGTGLGLPVAHEIVRLHGGTIALEEVREGTCFRVTIPDGAGG